MNPRCHADWIERPIDDWRERVWYHRPTGKLFWKQPEELQTGQAVPYTSEGFIGHAPLRSYFDFTYRCNLECKHCITSSSPHVDISGELPTARIMALISEIADIGVLELQTAGGEPFVHPDWQDIYRHIVGLGLNLIITTNGILLRPNVMAALKEIKPLEVRVSFDGGPTLHDHVRGPQSYQRAIAGMQVLTKAGLNATARLTLCEDADEELPALFRDLAGAGVGRVKVALVKPAGRAATETGSHLLRDLPDAEGVAWLLAAGKQHNLEVQLSADDFPVTFEDANDPKLRDAERPNCGAGFETAYISPHGELLGCVAVPNMAFGVLYSTSFMEAWDSKFADAYRRLATASGERRICDALCSSSKAAPKLIAADELEIL